MFGVLSEDVLQIICKYYINMNRIYLCLAHMSGEEQKYIQEAFDTNWVVPLGPNVNGFEADLETFVGGDKKVVALSAGTAAIRAYHARSRQG